MLQQAVVTFNESRDQVRRGNRILVGHGDMERYHICLIDTFQLGQPEHGPWCRVVRLGIILDAKPLAGGGLGGHQDVPDCEALGHKWLSGSDRYGRELRGHSNSENDSARSSHLDAAGVPV
jgi:hypothetical protein